ncbi:hypothetical protein Halar_0578 (plasmid) [halophilic archaeon DL31]|jgi:hypothetical protein|nr:hypothetical protein Halar_0578 [halophilic archaeon DL31]
MDIVITTSSYFEVSNTEDEQPILPRTALQPIV